MIGEIVADIIGNIIFSLVDYPGAFIHWLLRKKKMPFKEIEQRYFGINLLLSLLLYCAMAWIIYRII